MKATQPLLACLENHSVFSSAVKIIRDQIPESVHNGVIICSIYAVIFKVDFSSQLEAFVNILADVLFCDI